MGMLFSSPHSWFRAAVVAGLFAALAQSVSTSATTKKPPPQPINLNAATSEELQQVPGIGPATADKILQMRKSYGPFKTVDDLLAIRGIGKKRLDKMRKYLVAGRAPSRPPAGSSSPVKPASCTTCTKNPAGAEAAEPKSFLKSKPPSQKPANTPAPAPEPDEGPQ
jgi:comEA protein